MAQNRQPFRLVHTADLHLDSPLRSLAGRDPALARKIAGATRATLERIVDLCIEQQVDALAIAGDLYDGPNSSVHTAAALSRALRRLGAADIPVYLILGNHDAESKLTAELELPANAHLFRGKDRSRPTACGRAVFHGVSYSKPKMSESLIGRYAPPVAGVWNIGLMHTSLTGESGHHTYAPCHIDDLVGRGYDYWGLGHIHKRCVHREQDPAVVMPGIPQGRHVNEAGAKSVTLVTLDEAGVTLAEHDVSSARFERATLTVAGEQTLPQLSQQLEALVSELREQTPGTDLVLRVELAGFSPMAARIARELPQLSEELRQFAAGHDGLWIDSVRSSVSRPIERTARTDAGGDDIIDRLAELLDDGVLDAPEHKARRDELHRTLARKLPKSLRGLFDGDAGLDATLERLAREGRDELLDALRDGEASD